ncbi:hypothetical protein M758_3G181100 [Ceratodon purpureus]|nr:hypothetical protein M758_3G181100 [Ceratodon purpureus]
MSTYGGDSWVPEAMRRKQQVDHVLQDVHLLDRYSDQWRRLSNGRIACLVCPHRPVLDTFPMLVIHRKGEKHQAAAVKHEERDFRLRNEIQKRTALEPSREAETVCSNPQRTQTSSLPACSPLLAATRKRTAQVLAMSDDSKGMRYSSTGGDVVPYTKQKFSQGTPFFSAAPSQVSTQPMKVEKTSTNTATLQSDSGKRKKGQRDSEPKVVSKEDQDRRHERERLLRLREAGWRLDGNGKWFRDESVEFDSDEEAPTDLS